MNLILETIAKEKKRIEYQLSTYMNMIDKLPKGTLSGSNRNGQTYYYLKYRENGKVVSKYVGTEVSELQRQIEKRKHISVMIKALEEELKIANRALEGNL